MCCNPSNTLMGEFLLSKGPETGLQNRLKSSCSFVHGLKMKGKNGHEESRLNAPHGVFMLKWVKSPGCMQPVGCSC